MASRPRSAGVSIGGIGCPPGPQFGGNRGQQSSARGNHQYQRHRQHHSARRTTGLDPWFAGTAPACITALALSRDAKRLEKLSFGCPNLDAAFEGGVRVQGITEIAGEAGAGKTQLCLQLLLQAQLAPAAGGLGGKSYVLTCGEGVFPSRRLRQMASSFQSRHGVRPEKLMEGVCIQNAKTLDDQMMIIMEHLPHIMQSQGIKLVVIDSIAALFRSDMGRGRGDVGERSRLLGRLSQQMKRLGDRHGAAFVVVNQVAAKFGPPAAGAVDGGRGRDGAGGNVPAMGLLWSQCINARFMVRRRDYRLSLQASSSSSSNVAPAPSPSQASAGTEAAKGGGRGEDNPRPPSEVASDGVRISGSGDGGGGSFGVGGSSLSGMAAAGGEGSLAAGGDGAASAVAREITLEMSPCVPVHAGCGFVIEKEGVRGVGR